MHPDITKLPHLPLHPLPGFSYLLGVSESCGSSLLHPSMPDQRLEIDHPEHGTHDLSLAVHPLQVDLMCCNDEQSIESSRATCMGHLQGSKASLRTSSCSITV
ncbi:hypothetical protein RRG08_018995 [Elysia crispata]|uniref:Uncharacterized protein n=1 Tax=Elysia crispata TaxID=231223 RepID=A0AAE1A512_9GAST|nr:hypothetical protein RRG08_018995 [Elysia crispata]